MTQTPPPPFPPYGSSSPQRSSRVIALILAGVLLLVGVATATIIVVSGSDDEAPAASVPSDQSSKLLGLRDPAGIPSKAADLTTANANADLNVTVVAEQWSWRFNYTKGGSALDQTVWETGTPDDLPQLWLVKGRSVTFTLFSPDVIHSFWLPDLLFKTDVVPGRAATSFFTVVPERLGAFTGRCAELCGEYHSRMLFDVKVVTQEEFDAHLADLEEAGNVGLNVPAGFAEEIGAEQQGAEQD